MRSLLFRWIPLAALALLSCARGPHAAAATWQRSGGVALETVAQGLEDPVHVASPAGDPRLFIVEQPGRIRIVKDDHLLATPFLDIRPRVRSGGERGLLSVSFHPRYAENGFLFVNFTDLNGDTHIERFTAHGDRADPQSAKLLLFIKQPYANHNGGLTAFGPDGMLWIGMGDGGAGGDPHGNGQNLGTLLAKMLRIDVDHGDPYAVPPDNPFVDRRGARPEIWAYGLRNPWRFSFDAATHTVQIADVGQNQWEEIDVAPVAAAGLNYGWNVMESAHCFRPSRNCDTSGLVMPVLEYAHDEGCSITGGAVYRGSRIPALAGAYVFSDYCSGWLRSFRYEDGRATDLREWNVENLGPVSSFGEDAQHELYVVQHANGRVLRLVPAAAKGAR